MKPAIASLSLLFACLLPAVAEAQFFPGLNGRARSSNASLNPGVVPPNARIGGRRYSEWAENWWRRAVSIPASTNPTLDPTGAFQAQNQSGPVYYLAGSSGSVEVRAVRIPRGKHVLFPIINILQDYPCPDPSFCAGVPIEDCLRDAAAFWMDAVTSLECSVDGVPLRQLNRCRAISRDTFTFTGDPSLTATFDSCITGTPQTGFSDGFWVMLEPLSAGIHVVHFRGVIVIPGPGGFTFAPEVTYMITVG